MGKRVKTPTKRKTTKPERGYADNIAIAVIAGVIIMIAIFYAVAKLGQVSAPSLPNPTPSPSPTPPTVSATPSPTDSTEPIPSPVATQRATPPPTRSPLPATNTPSPVPQD